ncbi:hypothetical protein D3C78_1936610 [compost metagenome]
MNQLLNNYKELLNFKNPDHRGNYKFVSQYVNKHKNNVNECSWFISEAIDLHKRTIGRVL